MNDGAVQHQELEVTWGRVFSVWWLMVWRFSIFIGLLSFLAGVFLAAIVILVAESRESATVLGGVAGLAVGLVVAVFVVRMALRKKYKTFRIALVPAEASPNVAAGGSPAETNNQ